MKKAIIIILIAVVAATSVFAADFSLGVAQNRLHTMIIGELDGEHFGVEGAVGIPLVYGILGTIDYISRGGINEETGEKEEYDLTGLFLMPGGVVNVRHTTMSAVISVRALCREDVSGNRIGVCDNALTVRRG